MAEKLTLPDNTKKESDTVTVNLTNPTRARRVIFDGIPGSNRCITVESFGGTVKNVTLHRSIYKELRDANTAQANSELIATLVA